MASFQFPRYSWFQVQKSLAHLLAASWLIASAIVVIADQQLIVNPDEGAETDREAQANLVIKEGLIWRVSSKRFRLLNWSGLVSGAMSLDVGLTDII